MRPTDWWRTISPEKQRTLATTNIGGLQPHQQIANSVWYRSNDEYDDAYVKFEILDAEFERNNPPAGTPIPRRPMNFWGKGPRPKYPPHLPAPPPEEQRVLVTASLPILLMGRAETSANAAQLSLARYVEQALEAVLDAETLPESSWSGGVTATFQLRISNRRIAAAIEKWGGTPKTIIERALSAIHPPA